MISDRCPSPRDIIAIYLQSGPSECDESRGKNETLGNGAGNDDDYEMLPKISCEKHGEKDDDCRNDDDMG